MRKSKIIAAGRPSKETQAAKRLHLIKEAKKELLRSNGTDFRLNQVLNSSGGSKTTLYKYFGGRDGLLEAVLREIVASMVPDGTKSAKKSPKEILLELALATYKVVLSPEALALYRMAIGEGKSAPKISRIFFETGPSVARKVLCGILEDLKSKDILDISDIPLAADFFFGMLLEGPLMREMLSLGLPKEDLNKRAGKAVDVFVKAYS